MNDRRPLVAGIPSPEQKRAEKEFVYGDRAAPPKRDPKPIETPPPRPGILPQLSSRVPITTRTRAEVASALKRASLQRQLDGVEPYYVQDIMEEALEAWLREHDYLD